MANCYLQSVSFRRQLTMGVIIFVLLMALAFVTPWRESPAQAQGRSGLVLAFYYAWYSPDSFGPGKTAYQPAQPYLSSDPATIERHVNQARSAGIDGFVQSWYGPSEAVTNGNFQTLLDIAAASGFRAAVDFEPAVTFNNNEQRAAALQNLLATHANHPAYLRVDGKPVIFFWANWAYSVEDWAAIRSIADPQHNSIWIAEGSRTEYLEVFDGLHLYNIAWSANPHGIAPTWGANTRAAAETYGAFKYWVATAMPGFDDRHLGRGSSTVYRDRANGAYYQNSFAAAAASSPDMLIITSFNEWAEGSNIEPSTAFGSTYLELTAQLIAGYKSGGVAPPPPLPQPTTEPTSDSGDSVDQEDGATSLSQLPTGTSTPATATALPTPLADGRIVYEVQEGDTLSAIAFRFGTSLQELYRLNDLNEDSLLSVGQPITIGLSEEVAPETEPAIVGGAEATAGSAGGETYQVSEGDTLLGIALQHDLSLEELLALNPTLTEASLLQLGQEVVVTERRQPLSVGGSTDFPEDAATNAAPNTEAIFTSTPPIAPTVASSLPTPTPTQAMAALPTTTPADDGGAPAEDPGADSATENEPLETREQRAPLWLLLVAGFVLVAGAGGVILYFAGSRKGQRTV